MIICIGREFGSGGHEIGRIIAEKLGIQSFIVRNGLRYARSFSQEQLRYAVETAVQTEFTKEQGVYPDYAG